MKKNENHIFRALIIKERITQSFYKFRGGSVRMRRRIKPGRFVALERIRNNVGL